MSLSGRGALLGAANGRAVRRALRAPRRKVDVNEGTSLVIGSFDSPVRGRSAPSGLVTLLDGGTFCISAESGDIDSGGSQGLFIRDTRFVSCLRVLIDGQEPEPLSVIPSEPYSTTFVSRT